MSTSIDERVVELRFDNAQFESSVKTSMSTLDRLKQALKMEGASAGLNNVGKASANTSGIAGLAASVEALEKRFSTLGIVGMRVIQNLTDSAMNLAHKGIQTVTNSLVQGGIRRAMNIENARFSLKGLLGDEEEVQRVMDNAMDSVTDTAYGMDQAAMAASMFAASGVKAGDQMYHSLLAIAGVAAQTNSEYSGVANVFTTVAGQGRLMGDQLNQLAARGLNAASTIADYFNKVLSGSTEASASVKSAILDITDGAKVAEADIREFTSKGKINFEIFASAMDDAFGAHAKEADRTFTGAMANVKAALAQIGQKFVSPLIVKDGPIVKFFQSLKLRIKEVKNEIDPLANLFTRTVNRMAKSLATFLTQGRPIKDFMNIVWNAVDAVINIFSTFGSYLRPFGEAFAQVFPKVTVQRVEEISKSVKSFTERLILNEEASRGLKNILVAILTPIKTIAGWIGKLIPIIGNVILVINHLVQSFLGLFAGSENLSAAGESVVRSMDNMIGAGNRIKIFDSVKLIFENLVGAVLKAKDAFFNFVDTIRQSAAAQTFIEIFNTFIETAKGAGLKAVEMIANVLDSIAHLELPPFLGFSKGLDEASESAEGFTRSFGGDNGQIKGFVGTVSTLRDNIKELVDTMNKGEGSLGKALNKLKTTFENGIDEILNGNNIRLAITSVFGVLIALLIWNTNKLVKTMNTTISGGIIGAFVGPILGPFNALKLAFIELKKTIKAAAILEYAAALAIFAASLKMLGQMEPDKLLQGAIAIGALSLMIVKISKALKAIDFNQDFGSFGVGVLAMAAGILVLVGAIELFNLVGLDKMTAGLFIIDAFVFGLSASLGQISQNYKQLLALSGILISLSWSLALLMPPLLLLSFIPWPKLVQGFIFLVGGLVLLMGTVNLLSKMSNAGEVLKLSADMLILAAAINALMIPILIFSVLPLDALSNGLTIVAGALGIMLIALGTMSYFGMQATGGAAGILLLAIALDVFTPSLLALSLIPYNTLASGIGALVLALGVLVGAGFIAGIPQISAGLIVISGTLLSMSASFALAGAGAMMFGKALLYIGVGLPVFVSGLIAAVDMLRDVITKVVSFAINLILELGRRIWEGIGNLISFIVTHAPQIFAAAVNFIGQFIQGILTIIPKLPGIIGTLLGSFVHFILDHIPDIIIAGVRLVEGLILGIFSLIGAIAKAAWDLVTSFLAALFPGTAALIEQGKEWIKGFLNGIKEKIGDPIEAIKGMADGIVAELENVDLAEAAFDIISGLVGGLLKGVAKVWNAAAAVGKAVVEGMRSKEGVDANSPAENTREVGHDSDDGVSEGLLDKKDEVFNAAADVAGQIPEAMRGELDKNLPGINSVLDESSKNLLTFGNTARSSLNLSGAGSSLAPVGNEISKVGDKATEASGELTGFMGILNKIGGAAGLDNIYNKVFKTSNILQQFGNVTNADVEEGDNYFRALRKDAKATDELGDATDDLTKSLGGAGRAAGGAGKGASGAAKEMDKEKKSAEDLAYALNYTNTVTWEYFNNYTKHHNTAEGIEQDMALAQAAIYQYGEELVRAKAREDEAFEGGEEAIQNMKISAEEVTAAIAEMGQGIADNIEGQMDIFEEFDKKTELTGDQLLANMESQISGVSEWANNMQILAARGIDEGLLQKLGDLGPKGYEKVNAFVQMSDSQLQRANQLYATSLQLPASASTKIVASYALAGVGVSKGYAEGIDQHAGEKESEKMGENSLQSLKDSLGEKSPSKYSREMGVNVCVGLTNGINQSKDRPVSAAASVALAVIAKMKETLTPEKFKAIGSGIMNGLAAGMDPNNEALKKAIELIVTKVNKEFEEGFKKDKFIKIGEDLCDGLVQGIKNKQGSVYKAAQDMAKETLNRLKKELKEKSPSKATREMGEFLGEGLQMGIDDTSTDVYKSVTNMGKTTLDKLRKAFQFSGSLVDEELDFNPTITPVLDLSEIQNQASSLLDMLPKSFNIDTTMTMAEEASRTLNRITAPIVDPNAAPKTVEPTNNNYNFTQNNYSPKALSRLEIYRQTKNQFSAMKGVVSAT